MTINQDRYVKSNILWSSLICWKLHNCFYDPCTFYYLTFVNGGTKSAENRIIFKILRVIQIVCCSGAYRCKSFDAMEERSNCSCLSIWEIRNYFLFVSKRSLTDIWNNLKCSWCCSWVSSGFKTWLESYYYSLECYCFALHLSWFCFQFNNLCFCLILYHRGYFCWWSQFVWSSAPHYTTGVYYETACPLSSCDSVVMMCCIVQAVSRV